MIFSSRKRDFEKRPCSKIIKKKFITGEGLGYMKMAHVICNFLGMNVLNWLGV
jgi:hypothetical protein